MEKTKVVPPAMTAEQRARALVRSAEARAERAAFKDRIRSGEIDAARVAAEPGDVAGRMRLYEFLTSCPGVGPATARRIIREIGCPEARRLRGLGSRQRDLLTRILAGIAAGAHATAAIAQAREGQEVTR